MWWWDYNKIHYWPGRKIVEPTMVQCDVIADWPMVYTIIACYHLFKTGFTFEWNWKRGPCDEYILVMCFTCLIRCAQLQQVVASNWIKNATHICIPSHDILFSQKMSKPRTAFFLIRNIHIWYVCASIHDSLADIIIISDDKITISFDKGIREKL